MRWLIIGIVIAVLIGLALVVVMQQQAAQDAVAAKLSGACVELTGEARSACDAFARDVLLTPDVNAAQCAYDYDAADAIFRCMGLGVNR